MDRASFGPLVRVAIVSLILCGFVFPIIVTGIAQVLMPYQANGELVQYKGRFVGSILIAQNFTSPKLFHPWNGSASRVDPDITLQDAYSQIPRIHAATDIPTETLEQIVNQNVERTLWITGDPYVNVLKLNLILIKNYPSIYTSFI